MTSLRNKYKDLAVETRVVMAAAKELIDGIIIANAAERAEEAVADSIADEVLGGLSGARRPDSESFRKLSKEILVNITPPIARVPPIPTEFLTAAWNAATDISPAGWPDEPTPAPPMIGGSPGAVATAKARFEAEQKAYKANKTAAKELVKKIKESASTTYHYDSTGLAALKALTARLSDIRKLPLEIADQCLYIPRATTATEIQEIIDTLSGRRASAGTAIPATPLHIALYTILNKANPDHFPRTDCPAIGVDLRTRTGGPITVPDPNEDVIKKAILETLEPVPTHSQEAHFIRAREIFNNSADRKALEDERKEIEKKYRDDIAAAITPTVPDAHARAFIIERLIEEAKKDDEDIEAKAKRLRDFKYVPGGSSVDESEWRITDADNVGVVFETASARRKALLEEQLQQYRQQQADAKAAGDDIALRVLKAQAVTTVLQAARDEGTRGGVPALTAESVCKKIEDTITALAPAGEVLDELKRISAAARVESVLGTSTHESVYLVALENSHRSLCKINFNTPAPPGHEATLKIAYGQAAAAVQKENLGKPRIQALIIAAVTEAVLTQIAAGRTLTKEEIIAASENAAKAAHVALNEEARAQLTDPGRLSKLPGDLKTGYKGTLMSTAILTAAKSAADATFAAPTATLMTTRDAALTAAAAAVVTVLGGARTAPSTVTATDPATFPSGARAVEPEFKHEHARNVLTLLSPPGAPGVEHNAGRGVENKTPPVVNALPRSRVTFAPPVVPPATPITAMTTAHTTYEAKLAEYQEKLIAAETKELNKIKSYQRVRFVNKTIPASFVDLPSAGAPTPPVGAAPYVKTQLQGKQGAYLYSPPPTPPTTPGTPLTPIMLVDKPTRTSSRSNLFIRPGALEQLQIEWVMGAIKKYFEVNAGHKDLDISVIPLYNFPLDLMPIARQAAIKMRLKPEFDAPSRAFLRTANPEEERKLVADENMIKAETERSSRRFRS